jgi:type VI secretion system protein ImpC
VSDDLPIKGSHIGFGSRSSGGGGGSDDASARGPLRIVLVSALAAAEQWTTRSRPAGDVVPVDKATFDKVMARLAPSFAIDVRDPFEPEAEPLKIDLRFGDLKSLRADGIVEQVPVLRALVEARKVVAQIKDRKLGAEDGRKQLARILPRASWADALAGEVKSVAGETKPAAAAGARKDHAPASPPATMDTLDALFEKVAVKDADVTAEPPPVAPVAAAKSAVPSEFSALIAQVARGGKSVPAAKPAAVVGSALEKVERAFGRIFVEVLHHPEVRRLERAWRGLKLLVDGIESRAGVELDVVPVDKDGVEGAIAKLEGRVGAEAARSPVDLFVVDHDAGEDDAPLLAAWARACADCHAPLVVNGRPGLLGVARMGDLPKALRALAATDDVRPEALRALAANDATRWITVAMNGPLVRAAYTSSSSRLREIPFSENPKDPASHVFAGAAIGVGVLCAKSYVRTGWPTAIVGPRDGAVENLPVHEIEEDGQSYAIPLEVMLGDDALREAARAGVAMFGCGANHDVAFLLRAPTVFERAPRAGHSGLGDQLFVGRFASAVQQVAAALPSDVDPAAGARAAEIALFDLFEKAAPAGPEVSARVTGGTLHVTVRPRRHAGIVLEELTLAAPLGA